ncbi:MAG: hypothetical protein C5B51_08440 [Terriglobia bacterium]|nr:MAG: hypothetical protein C5B51_08440 [Terriglobia bacterium]
MAVASMVMQGILVDYVRRCNAGKRPSRKPKRELDERLALDHPRVGQLLVLEEALTRLMEMDDRQGRIVALMYYGGLTEHETAEALGISARTGKGAWQSARVWLQAQLRSRFV